MLTLLGTKIGIKGVGLDPQALDRLRQARALTVPLSHRIIVANDGGNRENTVPLLRQAGAETVVLGSLALARRSQNPHGLGRGAVGAALQI